MTKATYNKLGSWMAIFAVLIALFAPTVSQAMSSDDHSNVIYQKVCSEHSYKVVPIELPSKHHGDITADSSHCGLCLTQFDSQVIGPFYENYSIAKLGLSGHFSQYYLSQKFSFYLSLANPPQAPPSI